MSATLMLAGMCLAAVSGGGGTPNPGVRPAAMAGKFYPEDAAHLRAAIAAFIDDAVPPLEQQPVGLLAPHAGYVYSGQIAADAWNQVRGWPYDVIVLLGTNHTTTPFAGAAVYTGTGFATPLGVARVDRDLAHALLARDEAFLVRPQAHPREHSLEVQVPFAQVTLPNVPILPIVAGTTDPELCARLGASLAAALQGKRALIVASSDLSHYPTHLVAARNDAAVLTAAVSVDPDQVATTIAHLERQRDPGEETCACGEGAIMVMLAACRALGAAQGTVLSLADSGETALGQPDRVVGYGALAVTEGTDAPDLDALAISFAAPETGPIGADDQATLLMIARQTIAQYLASETTPLVRNVSPRLRARQGAFVTLNDARDHLRGCIGHMADDLPLGQVVGAMALQAACNDQRFPAVTPGELDDLSIEISVLTPFVRVGGPQDIVVGRDGVVLRQGGRSAVFLPQVATEQGWDRDTLLTQLSRKAGLPGDAWRHNDAEFSTFQAQVFAEER